MPIVIPTAPMSAIIKPAEDNVPENHIKDAKTGAIRAMTEKECALKPASVCSKTNLTSEEG